MGLLIMNYYIKYEFYSRNKRLECANSTRAVFKKKKLPHLKTG